MSDRIFGPASMPTLENPHQRPSPWACKPGAGYWWQDVGAPKPVLSDDALTKAHVWFLNNAIQDTQGNPWAMVGNVPQVAPAGLLPAGAGPLSDANYYSLGTGNDILDFAGDFSACFVYKHVTSAEDLFSNGGAGFAAGYDVTLNGTSAVFQVPGVNVTLGLSTDLILNAINVTCFGSASGNILGKNNLGTLSSTAQAITPATAIPARLGTRLIGTPLGGVIYEAWFSTTTPSDALFTSIMRRVKDKLGITAW